MNTVNDDFNWVMKVLNSCETISHVMSTEKLFDNFKNKHKDYFKSLDKKDLLKKTLKNEFKTSMREKLTTIKNT
jgi:hypothetical protein